MLGSADSYMWLRYLAVERMQHYQNQLRYKPDRTFFHLELHGSVLDNIQELKEALLQCSCLESLFLDSFQCDLSTWNTLHECIQILATKNNANSSSSSSHGHQRRYFKVQLRRIRILLDDTNTHPDQTVLEDNDSPLLNTSGAYLAKSLSQLLHYLSELHVMDCDIPSYGAQVLFATSTTTTTTTTISNTTTNNKKRLHDIQSNNIESSSLQLLSLEGNTAIGNIGMTFLAQALTTQCLSNLHTLSVERVGASQDGLCTLLDAIRHHPNLACLNIMGNVMDHPTLQHLLDILIHDNTILQQIQWDRSITPTMNISSSSTSSIISTRATGTALPIQVDPLASESVSVSSSIEFWLRVNCAGRRWIVQDSHSWSLPSALWPWILQRFTHYDPDVLYYVLRSRPEFCSCSNSC